MKISAASPLIIALLGLILAHTSPVLGATDDTKVKKIPFHGKLQAVDATANTVTLEGKKGPRVFHLTAETKVTDGAGNPSALASAIVGEDVGGSYSKDATGTMMLNSLRLGAKTGSKQAAAAATSAPAAATPAPKPAPAPATAPAAPAPDASSAAAAPAPEPAANTTSTKAKKTRFSGKVVSVDATAGTLVVHGKADQTFTVTSSTKITGADNLAAITAGAKVSGSYEKSADGATLTVTTLKVGK
jgi:biotin carboxyl carrier protein